MLQGRCIETVMFGSENMFRLGAIIRDTLLAELKTIVSPKLFKKKIREWVLRTCPCRLCKMYVQKIGFL